MADIELVVRIDVDRYEAIKKHNGIPTDSDGVDSANAIMNGTPLPKGHGDLIDREIVWNQLREKEEYYQGEFMKPTTVVHEASMYGRLCGVTDSRFMVQDAPTIIEADKKDEGYANE